MVNSNNFEIICRWYSKAPPRVSTRSETRQARGRCKSWAWSMCVAVGLSTPPPHAAPSAVPSPPPRCVRPPSVIYYPREPRAGGRSWFVRVRAACGPARPTLTLLLFAHTVHGDYYEWQGQIFAFPDGHSAEDVHRPARRRLPPHKRKRWVEERGSNPAAGADRSAVRPPAARL